MGLEKKRIKFVYKNTTICLDKYPNTPLLLEVEGNSRNIKIVMSQLGYAMKDTCTFSFFDVIYKYHPGVRELKFEK